MVLLYSWRFWARENQLTPPGDWVTWVILAGRGYGKTRTGSEWVIEKAIELGNKRVNLPQIALVAQDAGDARDVMIQGESGIEARCPPWLGCHYEPSKKRLTFGNGVVCKLYAGDDPDSLRGPEHHAAWSDEICKWHDPEKAWSNLQMGLRKKVPGDHPRQIVTTTPIPSVFLKKLIKRDSTHLTTGTTYENAANLARAFTDEIISSYEGTRLGRQELYAEILDDNPNALFSIEDIAANRRARPDFLAKTVVAVDPPTTSNKDSDECGIIVAGRDNSDIRSAHYYVTGDYTVQGRKPEAWAARAISAYYRNNADLIVAEVNQGGDMVEAVIRQQDPTIPVRTVRATKGKAIRAEPIAGLYEQGRVHHAPNQANLARLEDQMINFDPSDPSAEGSPDRMDANIWALTALSQRNPRQVGIRST